MYTFGDQDSQSSEKPGVEADILLNSLYSSTHFEICRCTHDRKYFELVLKYTHNVFILSPQTEYCFQFISIRLYRHFPPKNEFIINFMGIGQTSF